MIETIKYGLRAIGLTWEVLLWWAVLVGVSLLVGILFCVWC